MLLTSGLARALLIVAALAGLTAILLPIAEALDLVEFDSITLGVMMQNDPSGASVLETRLWEFWPVMLSRAGARWGLDPLRSARLLSIFASLAALVLTYRLARRHLGHSAAWLAPLLLISTFGFWTLGLSGDNDPLPVCALLAGAILLEPCLERGTSRRGVRVVASGMLFGIAGSLHFSYLSLAAIGLLPLLCWGRRGRLSEGVRMTAGFATGIVVAFVPTIVAIALTPASAQFFDTVLIPGQPFWEPLSATSQLEGSLGNRLINVFAGGFYTFWPAAGTVAASTELIPYGTPPPRPMLGQLLLGAGMLAALIGISWQALRRRGWLVVVPVSLVGLRVVSLIGLQGWNPERWLVLLPFVALLGALFLAQTNLRSARLALGLLLLVAAGTSTRAMLQVRASTSVSTAARQIEADATRRHEPAVLVLSAKTADDQRLAYALHERLPCVFVDESTRPILLAAFNGRFAVLATDAAWSEIAGPGLSSERAGGPNAIDLREITAQPLDGHTEPDLGLR